MFLGAIPIGGRRRGPRGDDGTSNPPIDPPVIPPIGGAFGNWGSQGLAFGMAPSTDHGTPNLLWSAPYPITPERAAANYSTTEGEAGPWANGNKPYEYRRLSYASLDGYPVMRHSIKTSNQFGVPDTVRDIASFFPETGNLLDRRKASVIPIDTSRTRTYMMRYFMCRDQYRRGEDINKSGTDRYANSGKLIILCLGRGNFGSGVMQMTQELTNGSDVGIGANTMIPQQSDRTDKLATLVDHATDGFSGTSYTFGQSVKNNQDAMPIGNMDVNANLGPAARRWTCIEIFVRMNTSGNRDGFWKMYSTRLNANGSTTRLVEAELQNVIFETNCDQRAHCIWGAFRGMFGGTPQRIMPTHDVNEHFGWIGLYEVL